jgi:hypothetical protein
MKNKAMMRLREIKELCKIQLSKVNTAWILQVYLDAHWTMDTA